MTTRRNFFGILTAIGTLPLIGRANAVLGEKSIPHYKQAIDGRHLARSRSSWYSPFKINPNGVVQCSCGSNRSPWENLANPRGVYLECQECGRLGSVENSFGQAEVSWNRDILNSSHPALEELRNNPELSRKANFPETYFS